MKKRLDVLLTEKNLASSRTKAGSLIMSGLVYVNGVKEDKCGAQFSVDSDITVKGSAIPYVSRGGLKLEKAFYEFNLNVNGCICADIGASTGGFTDCMLQNGAGKVYAVDVGYGQLDWKLRNDPRVICLERFNARYITKEIIPEDISFFSCDVSFISIKKILPSLKDILSAQSEGVCLIKPQFEAGREKVGKKGVVKDINTHIDVIKDICTFSENEGFRAAGLTYSPIKGPEGNIEYLLYLKCGDISGFGMLTESTVKTVAEQAHMEL